MWMVWSKQRFHHKTKVETRERDMLTHEKRRPGQGNGREVSSSKDNERSRDYLWTDR